MAFDRALRCRECGREYPLNPIFSCEFCFGPLEVAYDYDGIRESSTRDRIERGPTTLWRYADFLPCDPAYKVDIGTGYTPLIRADRLAKAVGLDTLWLKNDTVNPSWSFKDRVVSVAIARARQFGFEAMACASTGNLANSVAAHSAAAGMDCFVFIPNDLEQGKVVGSAIYRPTLVMVEGSYDDVNRLCTELSMQYPWAFVNINVRPYYAEGSKTIGFEIAEQLGWRLPEQIVVPVASGAQLVKIDKAFRELAALGLVEDSGCRVFGAQATGCSPVAAAFRAGQDVVQPVRPDTIAKSLAIGNPADGPYVLDVVRRTGGLVADVSDGEIVAAIRLLASTEGIFGETAAGVTLAVLRKLLASGHIDPDAETVIINSGDGLKTLDAVAGAVPAVPPIRPSLEAFAAFESSPNPGPHQGKAGIA